ncbi:Clr6 histone deacetylase associated PHD protein-2 Cph2 [Zalaria obscura]|uniref:Clr6 histone deacetylase associated PHD protein-2 Cph2 n=1 Tax=Zalaria obscura TaxID=2024903 RepID=A0ACC3SKV9_9PEZI
MMRNGRFATCWVFRYRLGLYRILGLLSLPSSYDSSIARQRDPSRVQGSLTDSLINYLSNTLRYSQIATSATISTPYILYGTRAPVVERHTPSAAMDANSWQEFPSDMPDLVGQPAIPYNPEDWEDWLRWDPQNNNATSPESLSKTSNDSPLQDLSFQRDQFPALGHNDTLAPPLIVGDDFGGALGNQDFNFGDLQQQDSSPFVFGGDATLQPVIDHLRADTSKEATTLWPSFDQDQSQNGLDMDYLNLPTKTVPSSYPTPSQTEHSGTASQPRTSISSGTSPEPVRKKAGRKRKSSSDDDEQKSDKSGSPNGDEPPVKKTSHNVIEKRYRNNLNDKIAELRDSVPSLRAMSRPDGVEVDSEDLEGLTPAHKLNKATVMAKATEYIKHLEKRNKTAMDEMAALKHRISKLEKAMQNSSAMHRQGNAGLNPAAARGRQGSLNAQALAAQQNMLQQQYMQQHAQPTYETQPNNAADAGQAQYVNPQGGNSFMSKLMVGSLAGLMVMEGFHEHEQNGQTTSGRGLFAVPGHLFKRGDVFSGSGVASQSTLPMLKMFLIFGALLYLVLPFLSFKPRQKQKTRPRIRLTAAPSLASPVEVRRKAWQTAVQSVWIPRHFLLEVVAVTSKMIKLSIRRLVGSERYSAITGITREDEAARIKAWDIAIDAQLAGGDAEVSYYRLLLTLMASGTLPDSPTRLMQKAVHFRIFFWEIANAGYGNLFMFKDFTAKVGRIYWDSARSQQRALMASKTSTNQSTPDEEIEVLPDHLAALLELDCDTVLTDPTIQRAYNLAWNRPSAENTTPNPTMDAVIEDHAIRSPLDAIAAWFANTTVDAVLARSLDAPHDPTADSDLQTSLDLATAIAPPASATQTRTLVARAVLLAKDREQHIAAALATLPARPGARAATSTPRSPSAALPLNLISHTPVSPDIRTALTLAKLLSLTVGSAPAAARLHAAEALSCVHLTPSTTSLLTAVAAFRVLRVFGADSALFEAGKCGLEGVSGCLRVWAGRKKRLGVDGGGLDRRRRGRIVETCVSVTKMVGGWGREGVVDEGYGSAGGEGAKGGA